MYGAPLPLIATVDHEILLNDYVLFLLLLWEAIIWDYNNLRNMYSKVQK